MTVDKSSQVKTQHARNSQSGGDAGLQAKPIWHGVILVAGGAVGAGMFALPLVSAGAWFCWAVLGLLIVSTFTYLAAKLLIDVNVNYPVGTSFDTLVRTNLGNSWATINNMSIAFIMFILMYAYITAGAGILEKSLASATGENIKLPRPLLSFLFASVVALFIWFGTSMVSRVSTLLMVAMCVTFTTANSGLLTSFELSVLFNGTTGEMVYLWSALPVFVTAFACAGLVPSLSSHYDNQSRKIALSILLGLLLALLVYVVWLASTLGNISRTEFIIVADNGGGLSALVAMLQSHADNSLISSSLVWFSHFAVITSFLSIGLGLAHFLVDKFTLGSSSMGRAKSVGIAFVPPFIASVFSPYGFVTAIAYAGVFVAFSFFIIPALMYRKMALTDSKLSSHLPVLVLVFGLIIIALKLSSIFSFLPSYP